MRWTFRVIPLDVSIAILSLTFSLQVQGAIRKVDSLKSALNQSEISELERIRIKLNLSFKYTYADPDSGLKWAKITLEQAQNQGRNKSIQAALHFMGVCYVNKLMYDSALIVAKKKYEHAKSIKDTKGLMDARIDFGNVKMELGQFDSAIYFYQTALDTAQVIGNKRLIMRCLINLGDVAKRQGYYARSLEYFREAERRKLEGFYGAVQKHFGELYLLQSDFQQAIFHYKKSINSAKINRRDNSLSSVYIEMGKLYENMGLLDSALLYVDSARFILKRNGGTYGLARLQVQMGRLMRLGDHLDSALKLLSQSIRTMELKKMIKELPEAYLELGACEWDLKQFDKSQTSFEKSYSLAASMNQILVQRSASEYLLKLSKMNGNIKQQLKYSEELRQLELKVFDKQQTRNIAIAQAEHEFERMRAQDEVLAEQKLLLAESEYQNQLSSEQNAKLILGIIGIMMLVLVLVIGFSLVSNRKKNKMLTQQKEVLQKSDEEKELLLKEIHHRVKNNLQVISSLLDLQAMKNPDSAKQLLESQSRVKSMALIHQKLYQNENLSQIDFEDYLKSLTGFIHSTFAGERTTKLTCDAENIVIDVDRAIPLGLIVNELLTNAFKYAGEKSKELLIDIKLKKGKSQLILLVVDNGPGINPDIDLNKPKSLGMRLVRRLSKQLKGELNYTFDNGARFEITFPADE